MLTRVWEPVEWEHAVKAAVIHRATVGEGVNASRRGHLGTVKKQVKLSSMYLDIFKF